jgi:hypothetical protein
MNYSRPQAEMVTGVRNGGITHEQVRTLAYNIVIVRAPRKALQCEPSQEVVTAKSHGWDGIEGETRSGCRGGGEQRGPVGFPGHLRSGVPLPAT